MKVVAIHRSLERGRDRFRKDVGRVPGGLVEQT